MLSRHTREIGECEREEGEGEERERGGRGVSEMRQCLKILDWIWGDVGNTQSSSMRSMTYVPYRDRGRVTLVMASKTAS